MRTLVFVGLMILFCSGCNRAEQARRKAVESNLKQLGEALQNYHDTHTSADPEVSPVMFSSEDGTPTEAPLVDLSGIVEGNSRFALDVYQRARTSEGNFFYSPSSMSTALAMAYSGARSETEKEMAHTLHFSVPQTQLHDGMKALNTFWKTPETKQGIELNLANRLWGQESYTFLPEFLGITREKYGAELAQLDFANSEQSRQTINQWIEQQTAHKITDLIPLGTISSDTRLVLTNAVYFHGQWAEPFEKEWTQDTEFFLSQVEKVQVPMMFRKGPFRFAAVDDLKILNIPYGDGSHSMVVFLPNEIDGLPDLEAKLTFDNLIQWTASLKTEDEVQVYLPRFKATSMFQLASTLRALGMEKAFDANSADFSGMTGARDLFISDVIHKAFVDVNEEGTEAAAATGIVMMPTAAILQPPKQPRVFRVDHPFLFMIQDNRNESILFLGRITNPLQ